MEPRENVLRIGPSAGANHIGAHASLPRRLARMGRPRPHWHPRLNVCTMSLA